MSNFVDDIIKNANEQIKYKNTVTTGEVTKVNGDGTYDVKINNAGSAIPDVETLSYDAMFSVGEIVTIGFENGCKESPKILGHSKKIKQDPKPVEVDYSGEEGGGVETVEKTIYSDNTKNGLLDFNELILESEKSESENYTYHHNQAEANGSFIGWIALAVGQAQNRHALPTQIEFDIYRSLLFFDLSVIPSNAKITSAQLGIWVGVDIEGDFIGDESQQDFNVVIQDGQPNYPHNPVVVGDYYYSKYHNNGGQLNTSGIVENAYNIIPLNSNGIAWLPCGGIAKLCIRSDRDISATIPGVPWWPDDEWIMIDNAGNRPKLTITYTI